MSDATMGDPERCRNAIAVALAGSLGYASTSSAADDIEGVIDQTDHPMMMSVEAFILRISSYSIVGGAVVGVWATFKIPPSHKPVSAIWRDCDSGGHLKRILKQVRGKLFPTTAPAVAPVPVSHAVMPITLMHPIAIPSISNADLAMNTASADAARDLGIHILEFVGFLLGARTALGSAVSPATASGFGLTIDSPQETPSTIHDL